MASCFNLLRKFLFSIVFLLLSASFSSGQDFTEKPSRGKPRALIFSNYHKTFADGNKTSAFEILRAYLGYEYNFNAEWYGYVVLDVGDPEAGEHDFSAFLKNAYVQYEKSDLTFLFGMIPTTQFKVAEDIWGLRYVDEVYQDLYGFSASADLGVTLEYKFADFISADFSVFNGEGYQKLQSDEYLKPSLGITLNPVRDFTARFYGDLMGGDVKQYSYSAFLAFQNNTFTAGAEYNYQKNVDMIEGRDRFGPSLFLTHSPISNLLLFSRYDHLKSNIPQNETVPWQLSSDGSLFMAGIEFEPVRGIKFAPNYRLWNPASDAMPIQHSIYFNCEVRF